MILYSTETCPRCKILKSKLNDKGINFEESMNVEKMQELGIRAVPVLEVDGELLDFNASIKYINTK